MFKDGTIINNSTFSLIQLAPYNRTVGDKVCLVIQCVGHYLSQPILTPMPCNETKPTICIEQSLPILDTCIMHPFDFLLDPGFETYRLETVEKIKSEYLQIIDRLDMKSSFNNIFYDLWYSASPCFDVQGLTAE